MNTKLLATLLAVHQHGSMAEAARRLNLSHGAVAQQLRLLERELKVELVRRAGKVVHLTRAAHRILAQSQKILDDIGDLSALANADELRGELRLGAGNTALSGRIPEILEVLGERYPEIRVNIHPGLSPDFYGLVEKGELDAAIALESSHMPSKRLGWELLSEEPFIMIASSRFQAVAARRLLEEQPFIRYHRDSWAGQQIDAYLKQHGIVPQERFELSSTEAIARMVHRNLGVAIVPSAWHLWKQGLDVTTVALDPPCKPRRFGLIWSRSSPRLQLVHAFKDAAFRVYRP
jgi:DNA-binding transcriptional LysR family regulator